MNREKIADWITKMCCQHLWKKTNSGKSGKLRVQKVKRSQQDWRRSENKRTRRRKCAGRDGIIAWKAKRIWLTVGMIMTNGSCWISWKCTTSSMSGKKINSFLVYDKESNGWLVCESRCESPQNDEQAIDCRPIIVHQRFAVCIDFNINSIWFCLRNVSLFFCCFRKRKQILREWINNDGVEGDAASGRARKTNVFSNHYKCNDPAMLVQREQRRKKKK